MCLLMECCFCNPCNRLYDYFMWCFNDATGVVVADALLHDNDLGSVWRERVGIQLVKPVDNAVKIFWWPPSLVWAAAVARFEADKVESAHISKEKLAEIK